MWIYADVTSQKKTSDGKRHAAHIRRQTSYDTASDSKLKLQDSHQQVYYIKSYCKTTHFFIFLNISTWLLHKRDLALGKKNIRRQQPHSEENFFQARVLIFFLYIKRRWAMYPLVKSIKNARKHSKETTPLAFLGLELHFCSFPY